MACRCEEECCGLGRVSRRGVKCEMGEDGR